MVAGVGGAADWTPWGLWRGRVGRSAQRQSLRVFLLAFGGGSLWLSTASAQVYPRSPRFELGVAATYWILDAGTFSANGTTAWGPSVRLGIRPNRPLALEAGALYVAPDDGALDPGISGVEVGLRVSTSRATTHAVPQLRLSLGLTALYFNARAREAALRDCTPENLCLFEGVTYRTGWKTALVGGVAVDVPILPVLSLQAGPDLVVSLAGHGGSQTRAHFRLRFGLGLRP